MYIIYMYMINTQILEKDKGKIYKLNPKATIFQRNIAASGGTQVPPEVQLFYLEKKLSQSLCCVVLLFLSF